jgi:prevent-host-death family protein
MSTYSIAEAQDQLSKLVDEVLEGKDVTITRHGEPVVEMRPSNQSADPKRSAEETLEWLRKVRDSRPAFEGDSVAEIRGMRDDF